MRRDWDARARENARGYINWPGIAGDDATFFESGRHDYARYVTPFFERMGFDPRGKSALEIGCGMGRLARRLAGDFAQVVGVDVSPEMVERARTGAPPNTKFLAVSGGDLEGVADASVDFVLSFAVFQHVPDVEAIQNYVRETSRVLRPDGLFRLHMKGLWTAPMGRLLVEAGVSLNPRLLGMGLTRVPFVRVRHLDTWQGISVPPPQARAMCAACGLEVLEVESPWTTMMWVGGRKR